MALNRNLATSGGGVASVDQVARIDDLEAREVIYSGIILSGSTSDEYLPEGWTVTNPSVGNYTVTHSLDLNEAVDAIVTATTVTGNMTVNNNGKDVNFFQLNTRNLSGTSEDASINFILAVKAQ